MASHLSIPFVWGPLGGGQTAPLSFWRYLGVWPTLREAMRSLRVRLAPLNPVLRKTARQAALALATNEETFKLLKRLGSVHAVYLADTAVDPGWLSDAPERPPPLVVAWVGRLGAHKAPLLALEAFALAARERDTRMIMVGSGPAESTCRRRAQSLGIADRVAFTGRMPLDEVRSVLASSHVFLFTSLRDSFPPAVIEALGVGLPLVTLNHQSLTILPENVGVKVSLQHPAGVASALGAALGQLLDDPELRSRLRANATLYVASHHLWANRIDVLDGLYRSLR